MTIFYGVLVLIMLEKAFKGLNRIDQVANLLPATQKFPLFAYCRQRDKSWKNIIFIAKRINLMFWLAAEIQRNLSLANVL